MRDPLRFLPWTLVLVVALASGAGAYAGLLMGDESASEDRSDVAVYVAVVSKPKHGTIRALDAQGRTLRTYDVGRGVRELVIAPPGAPNAGLIYGIGMFDKVLYVLDPTTDKVTVVPSQMEAGSIVVAPAGTPNAGTVVLAGVLDDTVQVLDPGASELRSLEVGPVAVRLAIAPAGVPGAGTLYVGDMGDGSVRVFPPGSTRPTSIATFGGEVRGIGVVPAGVPGAGTVIAALGDIDASVNGLATLPPGGRWHAVRVPYFVHSVVVVPAGAPAAGTVVLAGDGEIIRWDLATGNRVRVPLPPGAGTGYPVVAPAGTPAAGTLYVSGMRTEDSKVLALAPDSKAWRTIGVPGMAANLLVAPAGSPTPGAVYASTYDLNSADRPARLHLFTPDLSSGRTLEIGMYVGGSAVPLPPDADGSAHAFEGEAEAADLDAVQAEHQHVATQLQER